MRGVVITKKDKFVLDFLYKFRIATSIELSILLNVSNSGVYKRMKRLEKAGLVKKERYMILEYSYFLSEQGHVFLNAGGKEIILSSLNFLHELFITKIGVILLRDTENLELSDIYTEKDQFDNETSFFKGSSKAFPDLYIPKYNVVIEYERTDKKKERLGNKIDKNFREFSDCTQIWVVPRNRKTTIRILENNAFYISGIIAEEYVIDCLESDKNKIDLKQILKK